MEKIYNKLVRDKFPEIIEQNGGKPVTRILDDAEYLKMLKDKLLEEANEVVKANNSADLLEEIADIYEVLETIVESSDCDMGVIKTIATEKKYRRGGFTKKIYLEKVIED